MSTIPEKKENFEKAVKYFIYDFKDFPYGYRRVYMSAAMAHALSIREGETLKGARVFISPNVSRRQAYFLK